MVVADKQIKYRLIHYTHIGRHIFDAELSFAWSQWRTLFEFRLAKEPVHHPEAKDVGRLRLPLDHDVVVFFESFPDNDFLGAGGGGDLGGADQQVPVNLTALRLLS